MADDTLHKQFPPYVPAKGEEYMSEKQQEHFREILSSLKFELADDIERTVVHSHARRLPPRLRSMSRLPYVSTRACWSAYSTAYASSFSRLKNSPRNVPAHDSSRRCRRFSGNSLTLQHATLDGVGKLDIRLKVAVHIRLKVCVDILIIETQHGS